MPIHPSFQKILSQFTARYGDAEGKKRFYMWLNNRGLDDTKAYSTAQIQHKESFQWAKPLIKMFKQDKEAKYYQVEAHFAVNSMNNNIYTLDELLQAVHTLPGQHVDLNHNLDWIMPSIEITAAMVEDECAECILRVPNGTVDAKGRDAQECFDTGIYHAPSIEADNRGVIQSVEGNQVLGLSYTGLAVLDEEALPGIPLTTIQPLESLMVEAFKVVEQLQETEVKNEVTENTKQKEASAAYCPLCGTQLTEGKCPNKECAAFGKSVQMDEEKLKLTQQVADLSEQLATKTVEDTKLQTDLKEANGKIEKLSDELAKATRENVKVALGEQLNSDLKEKLTNALSESNIQRGKVTEKAKEITKLEEQLNKEHAALQRTEESLGKREAENEKLRRELNDESQKRASAEQKALNETKECSRVKLENADLLEEKAKDTRAISDLTEKLSNAASQHLKTEKDLAEAKEAIGKREEAIKQMQGNNEKAIVEQKRLYKILKENHIYEIDKDGNLVVPS